MEADVINGALDSDVFLVLRHHAETLHAIILQTLEHPSRERRSEAGRRYGRGGFYNQNSFICMQGNSR
jgi:hypothetical protein